MTALVALAALNFAVAAGAPTEAIAPSEPIRDSIVVHLGITLRMNHTADLDAFRKAQEDPASPEYHKWLKPEEFGARFGQPARVYAQAVAWLRAGGLEVTEYPNHTFIEARGTAAAVTKLLGVRLLKVPGQPLAHMPDSTPELPAELKSIIVHISGLDTRVHYHHHLALAESGPVAGS